MSYRRLRSNKPDLDLRADGKAFREVYTNPDVFHRILELASDHTLTTMMRTEKSALPVIARILYRKVHKSEMRYFSEPSPRSSIYAEAVRIIDQSPLPTSRRSFPRTRPAPDPDPDWVEPPHPPILMIPADVAAEIAALRTQFPHLTTIIHQNPDYREDDEWVVHLQGDRILVDLHSFVILNATCTPPTCKVRSHKFPKVPIFPGMDFRHTITIHPALPGQSNRALSPHQLQLWHDWLFVNPDLDSRVTEIDVDGLDLTLSYKQTMAFLARRKLGEFPVTGVYIPPPSSNLDHPADLLVSLNPAIRTLGIHQETLRHLGDTHTALAALDRALPALQHLTITCGAGGGDELFPQFTRALSGFPALRRFELKDYPGSPDSWGAARMFGRIGVKGCRVDLGALKGFQDELKLFRE